ncbi:Predicted dehydrogenase [Arthrobacter alpinus]|uniref:Predicted dehydrogenase n=1 Tax=Arthrobacter alpinus TaxID=656366 RepID=A0A1H5PHD3_9MICC|nr:Gfo/Idh/MocA family oxidoreductase [Arthrobacter alpinus]SEF13269.1 Predicted dehydrogenase [Arthrobacter alpinus]
MKVAIIGGGGIGSTHANAYRSIGANLLAVVEPLAASAEDFAKMHGVAAYSSLSELISSKDRPDAISICTPPFTHRELVEEAVAAGINILCEKPMAHTLEDAEAIYVLTQGSGIVFATGYCQRFQPELESIQELVAGGKIGEVRTFYNSYSSHQDGIENRWFGRKELAGGGVIIDTAIHSIDVFRYLCGEIIAASGTMSTVLGESDLAVEHTATIGLRSISDVIGTIDCSWKLPNGTSTVSVGGSAGRLTFDYDKEGEIVFESADGSVDTIHVPTGDRFAREVEAFLESVRYGLPARTGAFDGLVGLTVVDAIYRMHEANTISPLLRSGNA